MHGLQACCCCFIPHLCSVVVVKSLLKGEVVICALDSHGNYIVDHGKSWKIIVSCVLNFCWNPVLTLKSVLTSLFVNVPVWGFQHKNG